MQFIEHIGYRSESRVKARLENISYYPFHIHESDIEIVCILNGNVTISEAAAEYELGYGDVHIFNCNDPHKIVSANPDTIILTVQIDIDHYSSFFPKLIDDYFIAGTVSEEDSYSDELKHLRFWLARIYQTYDDEKSSLDLERYTCELLELLIDQFREYVYAYKEGSPANIVRLQNQRHIYKNYDRMYRIVDYVSDYFSEKLSLEQIAEMEFLSPAHLSRYLKQTLGLTFSQLVSLTRCEAASVLLSSTNKTVDQIALETGFYDRKHLASHFQKWYNKKPSQYRNEILNDLSAQNKIKLEPFDYDYALLLLNMYLEGY